MPLLNKPTSESFEQIIKTCYPSNPKTTRNHLCESLDSITQCSLHQSEDQALAHTAFSFFYLIINYYGFDSSSVGEGEVTF